MRSPSIDPLLVVHRPIMLDEAVGRGAAQRVFTLRVLMAFAAIALVLAALGNLRRVVVRRSDART